MTRFIPGKLYKQTKDISFPNENGLRNTLFYKMGEQIDNPSNVKEDDIMLVLDLLYTQRHKRTMKKGMHEPALVYMWHMKVLINDYIGYVSQWEDQWEEIS